MQMDKTQITLQSYFSVLITRRLCGMTMMILLPACAWAQSNQVMQSLSAPSDAAVLAARTINALGGQEAWSEVRSVKSSAEMTSNRRSVKTVIWHDDWSSGTLRVSRTRSAHSNENADQDQVSSARSNERQSLQGDATELSYLDPARALILAIQNTKCAVYPENDNRMARFSTHDIPSGQLGFIESCSGSPLGRGELHWRISATTYMPVSVYVPLAGGGAPSGTYVTVVYRSFIQQEQLKLPERVEIISNWDERKLIKFSNVTLGRANQDNLR